MPVKPRTPKTVSARELAQTLLAITPHWMKMLNAPLDRKSDTSADAINVMQLRTLYMLNEKSCTFKNLAGMRGISAPTLSRSINALVRRGWVLREPHPEDGRQLILALTDAGKHALALHTTLRRRSIAKVLERMTANERIQLAKGLEGLRIALSKLNSNTTGTKEE